MALEVYRKKRDFKRTSEPRGTARKQTAPRTAPRKNTQRAASFVIHKHAASHLHYDFRLELDGVLVSWAVPKGPSLDPADKRLALHVEDHPLEYGTFEGTIPQGQYGGGTVMVWDRGTWTCDGDARDGLARGELSFTLAGTKLSGAWKLVRLRSGDKAWLLMKRKDEASRTKRVFDVTREAASVDTGRSMEEIAAGKSAKSKKAKASVRAEKTAASAGKRVETTKKPAKSRGAVTTKSASPKNASPKNASPKNVSTKSTSRKRSTKPRARGAALDLDALPGVRTGALPRVIEPMRATLVAAAPSGEGWIHEIKFDGYRALCHLRDGRARWMTRGGLDWTARFASLSPDLEALPLEQAVIDGEIVALRADGTASFHDLQQALSDGDSSRLAYCAFDLLHLDGRDLRDVPLAERKRVLETLLARGGTHPQLIFSGHLDGRGDQIHSRACAQELEGIVCKRADSPYRSGRQRDWLKVKCGHAQEFVVGGFTAPRGSRSGLGALLVGEYEAPGRLRYCGRVGTGFDQRTLRELRTRLNALVRATSPFATALTTAQRLGAQWVEPELVVALEFAGWTNDRLLRHASFEGVREDKRARDVVAEKVIPVPSEDEMPKRTTKKSTSNRPTKSATNDTNEDAPSKSNARSSGASARALRKSTAKSVAAKHTADTSAKKRAPAHAEEVAGVQITHAERVVFPADGITKGDLARYYASVAERMLPHVVHRPLSILRCPEGLSAACFFQKHATPGFPSSIDSVRVRERSGSAEYLEIESTEGLVALVQMGAIELHPWGAGSDALEHPDRLVFDLDPAPDVEWRRVRTAAHHVHGRLLELGLTSFALTTGGKGIHVIVPLARKQTFDEVASFARVVCDGLVRAAPKDYIAKASKSERRGRIFLDYLRNQRGATAVAPYSVRARAGAAVAMPLAWSELDRLRGADTFTLTSAVKRLRTRDPWARFEASRQSLTRTLQNAASRA